MKRLFLIGLVLMAVVLTGCVAGKEQIKEDEPEFSFEEYKEGIEGTALAGIVIRVRNFVSISGRQGREMRETPIFKEALELSLKVGEAKTLQEVKSPLEKFEKKWGLRFY